MRGNKLHVDRTKKDAERGAAYARGGSTRMFDEQSAGRAKPGRTGKVQTPAPGAKAAKGGHHELRPRTSKPATPGRTSPPR